MGTSALIGARLLSRSITAICDDKLRPFGVTAVQFILLSLITRGGRFFILAAALNRFGDHLREKMEAHFGLFLGSLAAIVVGGFVLAVKLF